MVSEDAALASSHVAPGDNIAVKISADGSLNACGSNAGLCATEESIFATLADAEDASHGFLDDLLDGIFADLRVTDENERAIHATVSYAWRQVLHGCVLSAAVAAESLDADFDAPPTPSRNRLPQFVRPRIDEEASATTTVNRTRRRRCLNRPLAPVVPFLTELWRLIDRQPTFVETQLAQFPTSRFQVSAVPTHGRQGEWQIPVDELKPFLCRVVRGARVSVLGGTVVDYVVSVNATLLEKKATAKSKLQMTHIVLCVQTALLKAEAEAQDEEVDNETPTSRCVFQTEVVHASPQDDETDELLVCFAEGVDPPLLTVDRNASRSVSHKPELQSTIIKRQRLAKSIVSLLQQQQRGTTTHKWGAIRKRLLVRENNDDIVGIVVKTDMVLPLQKSATAAKLATSLAAKRKASSAVATSPMPTPSPRSPSKQFSEPDAATMSNIFSLGTPRQLSPDELARRNDILSLLERDDATVSRRMAVASITAVSVPGPPACIGPDGKPILLDHDKIFQAYVAANSSITMTSGSCVIPASLETSPDKGIAVATVAESKRVRGGRDLQNGKTRFELALEPPRFDVADGNSHARWAAAAAVPSEPMDRKARSLKSPQVSTPASPVSATKKRPYPPHSDPPASSHHPRPIDTASGNLPLLVTSRLAVGVKAVVRGVEKRGPRRDPSRNSRLRLHNYMANPEGDFEEPLSTHSPIKTSPEKRDPLPPVSPVKASPHRKHVAFPVELTLKDPTHLSPQRPPLPEPAQELSSPVPPPNGSRRFPAKQPTFEKRTSPPRVRNRQLSTHNDAPKSISKNQYSRAIWEERQAHDELTAMNAPRRNLASSDEY